MIALRGLAVLGALVWLAMATPPRAEEVVADLSQTNVALTVNFLGSEILVYGAIRREAPLPQDEGPLGVIVAVEGPGTPLTVWRKGRRAGVWANVDGVRIARAPSFYAVATSGPFDEVLLATEDLRHRVSVPRAIRAFGAVSRVADAPLFIEALIRIREDEGLYQLRENAVRIERDTLFSTTIALPANLVEGSYRTRIFLTRGGAVIDRYETAIEVRKGALERALFMLAQDRPVVYGLLAVLLAVALGWAASAGSQLLRR